MASEFRRLRKASASSTNKRSPFRLACKPAIFAGNEMGKEDGTKLGSDAGCESFRF